MKHQCSLALIIMLLLSSYAFSLTYVGDLTLTTQSQVDSFNYDKVTGALTIDGNGISNINALTSLDTVGELIIQNTSLASFSGLQNLKIMEFTPVARLVIKNNALITHISELSNLNSANNQPYVEISNNNLLNNIDGISRLFITGVQLEPTLVIDNNPSLLSLASLNPVKDSAYIYSIQISNNANLTNIDTISSIIHNVLQIINNSQLVQVEVRSAKVFMFGNLTISNNSSLTEVTIHGDNTGNNYDKIRIDNNPALKKISLSENGNISAGGVTVLNIYDNNLLDTIVGFNKPTPVTGGSLNLDSLTIRNNPNLRYVDILNYTFAGSAGFQFIGGVEISQNSKLTNLNFLSKAIKVNKTLNIQNNFQLVNCCGIYRLLAANGVAGAITISGNPFACSNESEIVQTCAATSTINVIKGRCYIDANHNQRYDSGEFVINNQKIRLIHQGSANDTTIKILQDSGRYSFITDTGKYIISCMSSLNAFSISPATATIQHAATGYIDIVDFIFTPNGVVNDASITLQKTSRSRGGQLNTYFMVIRNEGNQNYTGTVKFKKDHSLHINSSYPQFLSMNGDTVTWNISNLQPFESQTIRINVTIDSSRVYGDVLTSVANVSTLQPEPNLADNAAILHDSVNGSFDPNDKEVSTQSLTPAEASSGVYLTYIIHFQNTGNDTAFTITLRDTLEASLDPSSIQLIGSSHPCELIISGERFLSFIFDNIDLVDSTTNLESSTGYVVFKIKPKTTLTAGDEVRNRAAIIFDNNAPVITNTATTRIEVMTLVRQEVARIFKVFPNPARETLTIELLRQAEGRWILRDIKGGLIKTNNIPDNAISLEINIRDVAPGIYMLSVEGNNLIDSYKIIIER